MLIDLNQILKYGIQRNSFIGKTVYTVYTADALCRHVELSLAELRVEETIRRSRVGIPS